MNTQTSEAVDQKQCINCGELVEDYVTDRCGDVYCEECRDDLLSYCEHCNEYSPADDFVQIKNLEEWWCDDCASDAYKCSECGDYSSENYGDSDTVLCQGCYEDHYTCCDDCGEVIHCDYACFTDCGSYCQYCYDENHSSNLHDYGYKPDLNFLRSEYDVKDVPYLGFELEAGGMDCESERNDLAENLGETDYYFLKEDGSIPDYGFELVSHPATLKKHKELNWENTLKEMSSSGLRSHDLGAESCGLHVHVSRDFLTPYKWLLVDWLVSKHQHEFELIARRKENHWAKFKKKDGQPIKEVFGKSNGRYHAVNFCNFNTVEFRLFRGTLKYSTFMATLELVGALVHWAKQVRINDILRARSAFDNFTAYIQNNQARYGYAVAYLEQKNLI